MYTVVQTHEAVYAIQQRETRINTVRCQGKNTVYSMQVPDHQNRIFRGFSDQQGQEFKARQLALRGVCWRILMHLAAHSGGLRAPLLDTIHDSEHQTQRDKRTRR